MGRRHLANLRSLGYTSIGAVRVRGLPVPEAALITTYTNLADALADRPDAVFVTNPTSGHLPVALAAAEHGCHLFIEKPLSHTREGVDRLLARVSQRRLVGMIGYQWRFHPALRQMKELIDTGAIGRVIAARLEYGEYLPDWHPWEDYRTGYSARRELGGGPILTLSHTLDLAYWLLGQPARVFCAGGRVSSLEIETEDIAEIVLEYASGPVVSVHVDYVRRAARRAVEVIGESGVLRWDDEGNQLQVFSADQQCWRVEPAPVPWTRNDLFLAELRHFLECIEHGRTPEVDLRQGAAVLEIALAAHQSLASGTWITLPQGGVIVG